MSCCRLPSPADLRSEGLCPLTPEEAVLMLAALGFNRKTRIYVAGAQIYGGSTRLSALNSLYPYLLTKENLLSATELEPFKNFSSQVTQSDFNCSFSYFILLSRSGGIHISSEKILYVTSIQIIFRKLLVGKRTFILMRKGF